MGKNPAHPVTGQANVIPHPFGYTQGRLFAMKIPGVSDL